MKTNIRFRYNPIISVVVLSANDRRFRAARVARRLASSYRTAIGAVWKTDGPAHDETRFAETIEVYANSPDGTAKPNEICAQVYGTCKANVGPGALYMSDRIVDKIKVKRIRPDDSPNTVYVNRPAYPLNPTRVPIATLSACIAVLIPF